MVPLKALMFLQTVLWVLCESDLCISYFSKAMDKLSGLNTFRVRKSSTFLISLGLQVYRRNLDIAIFAWSWSLEIAFTVPL